MPIKSINLWQSSDSTHDLNDKFNYLVQKGLLWGGSVGTSASLTVPVNPLVAVNHDGMTVISDSVVNLVMAAGTKNVIVLYVKYNELGIPAVPVETVTVFDWATYVGHADKDWMNVLAVLDLPPAAVSVGASDIDYTIRDEVTPVGRNFIRGITTYALLPTPTSPTNRVDDVYWVSDHQVFYFWNGSSWEAINTGTYNAETTFMNDRLERGQVYRNVEGSGVVAGTRPGDGSFASYRHVDPIETPFVADSMDVDAFSAIINGHYIETHSQTIPFPLAADRLDLVFLEVWREDIITPENQLYDRNPDGTLKYNIQEVDDEEEAYNWVKGIGGNNYDFNTIEIYNHGFRVLKYRLAVASGVPQIALTNPNDAAVLALATNIDGAAFNAPPAGSDDRAWIAASGATPVDGYSWAIPLFVVRRLAAENPGIGEGIKVFRSGIRHVFQVYPICDILNAVRGSVETLAEQFPTQPANASKGTWDEPSGFLTGMDFQIGPGVALNSLKLYDERVKIRVRGMEDWFTLPVNEVDLGAAPAAGWARQLVYLKMQITRYSNDPTVVTNYMLSPQHRPYIPSKIGSNFRSQGWVKGFVSYELVVEPLGATNVLDEHDAMLAAAVSPVSGNPWERGDVTAPPERKYDDGGIWSRPILELEDDRGHPYGAEWAIPVCLIHRRNQNAYDFQSNPNGTGVSRPDDGRQAFNVIHPDDLVDLRHQVGLDSGSYKSLIEENIDLLMKGQLRTRLANKFLGAGTGGTVAGSRILQADIIGNAPGAFQLTAPDGMKRIWSDAREFHIVATTVDMTLAGPVIADLYEWQQLSPTEGELIIKAPPGASLIRHLPAQMYINGNSASALFMDFYGPPCWTTRIARDGNLFSFDSINPAHSKLIDSTNIAQDMHYNYYGPGSGVQCGSPWWGEPFEVIATDSLGRATQMRGYVDLSDPAYVGTAVLSWWVHYDRTFTNVDNYDSNYGLAEIPDTVHRVTKDPLGAPTDLNVGTLAVTIRKTLVAAANVSFTDAEVAAASGLSGTHTILGFDYENVMGGWSSAQITDVWDELTLTFAAPFTGDFEVTIFFETTTVDEWVEIGRGGKSIQALFSWHQQSIDFGGPPAGNDYAYNLGGSIWYPPEIDGRVSGLVPQFWTRASNIPGTPWDLNLDVIAAGIGGCYSNLISFNTTPLSQYTTVLVARHSAPPAGAANHILIEYTYTPYQGQSSEGGESPIIGTSLPKLKNLLHGVVEENSDFYATQSGATSYFSGVLSWTGLPVNNQRLTELTADKPNIGGVERFSAYNRTAIVKSNGSEGTFGLNHIFLGDEMFNAAAVLRLPFPTHFNLLNAGGNYHRGVADFDLDPVRAGSGSGTLSYAPGYGNPLRNNIGDVRYDHFLNSVAPFSVRGKGREVACNLVITPDNYQCDFVYSGPNVRFYGSKWSCPSGEKLLLYSKINPGRNAILKRTVTQGLIDDIYGSYSLSFHQCGLEYYTPENRSFIAVYGSPYSPADYLVRPGQLLTTAYPKESSQLPLISGSPVLTALVTCPGEIDYLYKRLAANAGNRFVTPIMELFQYPIGGSAIEIYETQAMLDTFYSDDSSYMGYQNIQNKFVDVIKVPISSQSDEAETSNSYPHPNISVASGKTNLRGVRTSYPPNWSAGDVSTLESLMLGAQDLKGAGRGVFVGDVGQNARFAMPILVPGSGADLSTILKTTGDLISQTAQPPPKLPTIPGEPLFDDSNRLWMQYDHGGPIAYVFMGLFVNPVADDYKNRLMLQISGGPTGTPAFPGNSSNNAKPAYNYSSETVEATALDAFWPKGRPLLSSGKKK